MSLCLMAASSSNLPVDTSRGLSVLCGRCIVFPRCERGGPGRSPLSWVICSVFMERVKPETSFCKLEIWFNVRVGKT